MGGLFELSQLCDAQVIKVKMDLRGISCEGEGG